MKLELDIGKNYNEARNIIFNTTLNRKCRQDFKPLILHTAWNKEFGSITMQLGRQTGATTWMIYKIYEQSILNKKSIVFTLNEDTLERTKQLYNEKINIKDNNIDLIQFYTFNQINDNVIRGQNPSFIFIDCSQLLSTNKYELIMKNAFCDLIIFL